MPIVLPPFEDRLRKAVAHYWRTLAGQSHKQKAGVDHGRRGAVTGGKQMDGFCELVDWLLRQNGLGEASIYVRTKRELPGFFRPTKDWDMLVVHEGHLIAAVEFKSQRGPYCRRYELLLRKLVQERLYDAAAFLASTEQDGPRGDFTEPAQDLTMKGFLAQLAGHVAGYLAAIK
jgi:hypothetical protein